jgi:mRNA-degrading endonuclease YafQ of YafQ-DinJ toxin-antitoxin module
MPKPKKRSRAGTAKSSELRSWPKPDRARAGKLIQRVQENFGKPHLHSGIGIRDLSPKGSKLNVYECRIGRGLRLVFTLESPASLYFHMIGNHDEVRRFLKSLL